MSLQVLLPGQASSFVGRALDVAELVRLVEVSRLVTLTGIGGIGKTRLALRVAAESADTFSDGVWLVELAGLEDEGLVAERVAAALNAETQELVGALSVGRQLLVLDNCEHLVEASAELCGRLLAGCPSLTILATSREPLRVQGEALWRVPPLPLTGTNDALRLFTDRANSAAPGRIRSDADEASIRALCTELEGIPLAIELAAAMTRVLSAEQIRSRLTDRFRLLSAGPRTAPARQRTLKATIEWSHQLLGADARELLGHLTVFRGGWTLEMAESICDLAPYPVLEATAELVDKSLVLTDGEIGGKVRYRMLDTVREFAAEQLPPGAGEELRARHLECVAAMAAHARELTDQQSPTVRVELRRHWAMLEAMFPNVFQALGHAAASGQAETGLRIAADLQWGMIGCGQYDEFISVTDRLLAAGDAPRALVGHVHGTRAALALQSGDVTAARTHAEQAVALHVPEGPRDGLVLGSTIVALLGGTGGLSLDEAFDLAEGNLALQTFVLYGRGTLAQLGGKLREAQRFFERMLELQIEVSEWGAGLASTRLARVARERGDLPAALHHFEEAERLLNHKEDPIDYRGERIRALIGLGSVAIETGDFEGAAARLAQGLALSRGLGQRVHSIDLVEATALLASRRGHHARAVLLASAAHALRVRMGRQVAGADAEHILEPATRALGSHEVSVKWSEGAELPWHRVVDHALAAEAPAVARPIVPPQPVRPASTLTDRELEIARLVARGLSNKALAGELVISPATVARHISNILTKLGFSSRAQIASWMAEHDRP